MYARGQLQHHFRGDYCATISLQFDTVAHARQAQQTVFTMFKTHSTAPHALIGTFGGKALEEVEALLKSHGANMRKVGSLARSTDFGEPFFIKVRPSDGGIQKKLEF
jgi:hypothetical protein